jgi:ribonuclease HI
MKITIYTDGSSRGNPGRGGWGAIITTPEEVIELGGREDVTTNNRMELMAAIQGLKEVGPDVKEVEVYTDSEYVRNGISTWVIGWVKNGWKTANKKQVLNQDLWQTLLQEEERLKNAGVKIVWKYVRGHSGVPLNERADVIATMCADASDLQLYRGVKEGYVI